MQASILLSSFVITLVGCASTPRPEPDSAASVHKDEVDMLAWGTSLEALQRRFPAAQSDGFGMTWSGSYAGLPATIDLYFDEAGLGGWRAFFTDTYASMDACGVAWARLRAEIDRRWGRSQADNLAPYWTSPGSEGELDCSPIEPTGAQLELTFSKPDPSDDEP